MVTIKYIVVYTQTQTKAYSDSITRINVRKFNTESTARHFLFGLMHDDMWNLDEYKFMTIEEWQDEKETKLAVEILKKLLTN